MKRNSWNFLIDGLSLLVLLGLVWTGFLLHYVLPPGVRGGQGLRLWGWLRHDFGDIHYYLGWTMIALMVLHIVLHWRWVWATVRQFFGRGREKIRRRWRRVAAGVVLLVFLAVLLVGTLLWAKQQVEDSGGRGRGYRGGHWEHFEDQPGRR